MGPHPEFTDEYVEAAFQRTPFLGTAPAAAAATVTQAQSRADQSGRQDRRQGQHQSRKYAAKPTQRAD
jgi:hypothetical protein